MLVQLLFVPLLSLIYLIINFLPNLPTVAFDLSALITFVRHGLYFTNANIFASCIATIIFCESALLGWNVIRFLYTKIPVINIHD
jgi:hypothetical protein